MAERPLLVLADAQDVAAQAFVMRHHKDGARLLKPSDLSLAGWCHRVGDPAASVAVVDGLALPASMIRGVVTRLSAVAPTQLPHVAEADRGYVASEMTAFLGAWLSALACPVVNRPRVPSLSGPAWCQQQWTKRALDLDVPAVPVRRELRAGSTMPTQHTVPAGCVRFDVIGPTILGDGHPRLRSHARRLADSAGMALLGVYFDADDRDACFVGADPWPDLSDEAIGNALMECLP
ncbi:hypothetical protein [Variovorax sp. YR216]|uniref:hypothetical protein n=1 Tax=Variovorax sp. YR216 TaxID=1882828 RepID=UPI000897A8E9|nr:hypothetical protein [Variovorax sp. YR216]SEB20197.1 hypothetical protein SAMN05444680_11380 [Variovorax sp. YR216]